MEAWRFAAEHLCTFQSWYHICCTSFTLYCMFFSDLCKACSLPRTFILLARTGITGQGPSIVRKVPCPKPVFLMPLAARKLASCEDALARVLCSSQGPVRPVEIEVREKMVVGGGGAEKAQPKSTAWRLHEGKAWINRNGQPCRDYSKREVKPTCWH